MKQRYRIIESDGWFVVEEKGILGWWLVSDDIFGGIKLFNGIDEAEEFIRSREENPHVVKEIVIG